MSPNANKTKHTLLASLLLHCLSPATIVLVVAGSSLLIAPAAHAQESYPDPTAAAESILDTYDPGVPNELATAKYYNHIVGTVSGGGQSGLINYWTPKKGGTVLIATNPINITQTKTIMGFPIVIKIVGTIDTWKG